MSKTNYGSAVMYAGGALGGAFVGQIVQNKVKFFDGLLGRIILLAVGILIFARAKSETLKAMGTGIAISGGSALLNNLAGTINGFDGLAGVDGNGVGQVVQDENGMLYMMNGMGELEPVDDEFEEIPVMGIDEFAISGVGSAIDEAIAGS